MKWYVGRKPDRSEIFQAEAIPTWTTHGETYAAVIGPFRTKRGALFMAQYGNGNPHCRTVAAAAVNLLAVTARKDHTMSLFQKRHYEWLSRFAAETLDDKQQAALADELARDNARFNRPRFITAVAKIEEDYGKSVRDRRRTPLLARKRAAGVL